MDVLVMLEEASGSTPVLARVNSLPASLAPQGRPREVVTLYGEATAESLALALAAAMESRREPVDHPDAVRHVGIWPERGAVGDAAWRDDRTGELISRDLAIPFETIRQTAQNLMDECGSAIRKLVAGLSMPDWPEGSRRAISFSLQPWAAPAGAMQELEGFLEAYRSSNGISFDNDGE
jgi:hypothetical protein